MRALNKTNLINIINKTLIYLPFDKILIFSILIGSYTILTHYKLYENNIAMLSLAITSGFIKMYDLETNNYSSFFGNIFQKLKLYKYNISPEEYFTLKHSYTKISISYLFILIIILIYYNKSYFIINNNILKYLFNVLYLTYFKLIIITPIIVLLFRFNPIKVILFNNNIINSLLLSIQYIFVLIIVTLFIPIPKVDIFNVYKYFFIGLILYYIISFISYGIPIGYVKNIKRKIYFRRYNIINFLTCSLPIKTLKEDTEYSKNINYLTELLISVPLSNKHKKINIIYLISLYLFIIIINLILLCYNFI